MVPDRRRNHRRKVVLEVRKKPVRISRIDVAVRDTPPDQWSIVTRTGLLRHPGEGREEVTTTYAVCPYCRSVRISTANRTR